MMFYKLIFCLALLGSASTVVSGQSLSWVFLNPGDGCSTVQTNCTTGQQCYGLTYTPSLTGTVTSYTLGFLANCVDGGLASLRGESCTMTDNTDIQSACAAANLIQILPSGNSGNLPITENVPVILHEVCVTLPGGRSMTFNEDVNLALTVSVDLAGGGAETDVLSYTAFTASSNDCDGNLPVVWESFSVQQDGKNAWLEWSTSDETDHDFFTVEWGTDGSAFTPIANVTAPAARQGTAAQYHYSHLNPAAGINYYRIRQVDYSGAYDFSAIKSLNFFDPGADSALTLSPNPAHDEVWIRLAAPSKQVQLYSMTGALIKVLSIAPEDQDVRLSLHELPKGVYLVRVGSQSRRLIKQ